MTDLTTRLPYLPTVSQMQKWDREAVAFGIPDSMLMENASRSAVNLLLHLHGSVQDKNILIFMGGGNNGGDAICMARYLLDLGANVLVAHARDLTSLKGAAQFHAALALNDHVPSYNLQDHTFFSLLEYLQKNHFIPDIVIDGLIGVALHGDLSPELAGLIENINFYAKSWSSFVLAIDVPSGLDADSGTPVPVAIKARATACMAFAKCGLVLPQARKYTGDLYVCNIGMPQVLDQAHNESMRLLDGRFLLNCAKLPVGSYKNIYGHVLILGGQGGTSGAAHLASCAALRAGAGLVTACVLPDSVVQVKGNRAEIMTCAIGDHNGWPCEISEDLRELLKSSGSVVIGPGMGRNEDAEKFLYAYLTLRERPKTVFDADALFHLARNPRWRKLITDRDVLTPHPMEAARLLDFSISQVEEDRTAACMSLMDEYDATIVLKGAGTLIGQKGHPLFLCPYDIPQLAIGGSGDVLSGLLGAIQARRDPKENNIVATARAVITHVCAGMICAGQFPQRGDYATDLVNAIPEVINFIHNSDMEEYYLGLMPWPRSR